MKTQILKITQIFAIALILVSSISLSAQNNNFWPELLSYDDGSAEDYVCWISPGGYVAVAFYPNFGYPFTVLGGELYVGDGTFPEGGEFLGTNFLICLFDDDGADGMPGTLLDSAYVEVENYEWIVFDSVFNTEIYEGEFYIAMKQLHSAPDCAPVGVDTDLPSYYKSYAKIADGEWGISPYQDFMIRAHISNLMGVNTLNANNINIYPNPATDKINIESGSKINQIQIFDLQGRMVLGFENLDSQNCNFNVSTLTEGTYLTKILSENKTISKKLVIIKQ